MTKRPWFVFFAVFICVSYFFFIQAHHAIASKYDSIGKISDPLLLQLLEKDKPYTAMSLQREKKPKAILLDGPHLSEGEIKRSNKVKEALKRSIPIVITKPTKAEVHALIGAEVSSDAMVIISKKRGEEFDIHLIQQPKEQVQASWIGVGPGPGGYWGNGPIGRVIKIIDNKVIRNEGEIGEFINDSIECHKRWTINPDPSIWGSQGQMINIGFQFDLYYVVSPEPTRKYLTVKTVGKGATPGVLRKNHVFHRGYYQNALSVRIDATGFEDWKGAPLNLEDLAPRTDNNSGQVQVTTGKQFMFGMSLGGANTDTGMNMGYSSYYNQTRVMEFRDFSVSQDPNPNGLAAEWTYWMSAANGAHLRRKHQANDLMTHVMGIRIIRGLPEMASGPWMKPYVETVYFAEGDETGKVKMIGSIGQSLEDIRNYVLFKKVRHLAGELTREMTIDFSQVNQACK